VSSDSEFTRLMRAAGPFGAVQFSMGAIEDWLKARPRPVAASLRGAGERQVAALIEEAEVRTKPLRHESIIAQRDILLLLGFDLARFELVLGLEDLSALKMEMTAIYHRSEVLDLMTIAGIDVRVVPGIHGVFVVPRKNGWRPESA